MVLEAQTEKVYFLKLPFKGDLNNEIQKFIKVKNISLGKVEIIGALTNLKVGYFDQENKKYVEAVSIEDRLEIVFAGEAIITKFKGPKLERALDKDTGLPLWK